MDVITYVDDLQAFRTEAKALVGATDELGNVLVPQLQYDAESDTLTYGVTMIPVLYDGNESITLIRIDDDSQLQYFTHMGRLGECANNSYVFDSPEAQAIYERVRGELTQTVEIDGEQVQITKPYMIGVFA